MIGIGSIDHGPEIRTLAVDGAISRMANLLRPGSPRAGSFDIEVIFEIPGQLGGPDYEGSRSGRIDRKRRRIQVFVAVPRDLATSAEPDLRLVDLTEQAIQATSETVSKAGGNLDVSSMLASLRRVREEVIRFGPAGRQPLSPAEVEQERLLASAMSALDKRDDKPRSSRRRGQGSLTTRRAGIEIRLNTPDKSTIAKAFELEDAVDHHLRSLNVGFVDGNEIGDGEFTVIAYGQSVAQLRKAVQSVVRTIWPGGATIHPLVEPDEPKGR